MSVLHEWQDKRSGTVGCLAGNIVLEDIQRDNERFKRLKGTIFISDRRVVVGRMCASESYLAGDWVHFCNLTRTHHKAVWTEANGKEVWYVFVTVRDESVHYWMVPHAVVTKILNKTKEKKSDSACIIRIKATDKKFDALGIDITSYHHVFLLNPKITKKIASVERDARQSKKAALTSFAENNSGAHVVIERGGKRYKGVLTEVS